MPFKLQIIGHRGSGCTDSPDAVARADGVDRPAENTLASFRAALRNGADGVETDAIRTRDDRLVLTHSTDYAQHVTGAAQFHGRHYIDELSLAEVQQLRVGPAGAATIPTLAELLDLLREAPPAWLNLELKDVQGTNCPRRSPSLVTLALAEIAQTGFPMGRIRFSSFSLAALVELAALAPPARIGLLLDVAQPAGAPAQRIFCDGDETYRAYSSTFVADALAQLPRLEALHTEIRTVSPAMVRQAAAHGLALVTWAWQERSPSQNTELQAAARQVVRLCRKHDVELALITDYPAEMRACVTSWLQATL